MFSAVHSLAIRTPLSWLWNFMRAPQSDLGRPSQRTTTPTRSTPPSDSPTPDPVLLRIAAGEPRAMNACIAQYANLVWGITRRYIKDASAEDVVQEVFTEIWKKAASFDPELASEPTFIGLITRRRAIDSLRRKSRQPNFEPLLLAEEMPTPAPTLDSHACDPESVKSYIAALSDDTRELFALFFDNGLTHPEIATKTGLPLGTVKTRLRRGLLLLRDQLRRGETSNPYPAS
jgi:RNA polymerase sigma-70 factor (ECF subfamily)